MRPSSSSVRGFRVPAVAALALGLTLPALAQRPAPSPPTDFAGHEQAWERHRELAETSLFRGLEWRSIGPVVQGGRAVDIESVPGEPFTFYVAYASGGLWKTTNNGSTFEPLFDHQPTVIMGDVAVAASDPKTVWVGSGENNSSRSSYGGMGVYRSTDAGATWEHRGLGDSDRIGAILVDPRDPETVLVGALGKLYTPGGERGVYRTTDGGATWTETLAGGPWTGVVEMVRVPGRPDEIYAATWERQRRPWNFVEGGPGSGVWKSTDGGVTWARLEAGLPQGADVGRIGLAVAASRPDTVYASVDNQELLPEEEWDLGDAPITPKRLRRMTEEELLSFDLEDIEDFIRASDLDTSLDAKQLTELLADETVSIADLLAEIDDANASLFTTDIRGLEVYRSDDAGATWRRTHAEPIRQLVFTYGYYFGDLAVSPADPDRIYVAGVPLITSGDGGATFSSLYDPDVHVDYQAIWIDPADARHLMVGNDGGVDVTYDAGATWRKLDAQPVGQFYTVAVDLADPYNVYGGLQDNGTLKGSSETDWRRGERWRIIGGGDGMYVQVDPRDDATTYLGFQFGFYQRIDADGSRDVVRPRDALGDPALRYNWSTPIHLSSHNPDVLYFGANVLHRSLDRGVTWKAISPDLTQSEKRGDVPFATLSTIDESPLEFGLLWAGTDDGLVQVTEDGGVTWRRATEGLVADRWVSRVEASAEERATAYVALNGYRDDDATAYLYRSTDLGRTWTSIAAGLPAEPINVVREDPVTADVLYVGTDKGAYVSLDRGATWQALPGALPTVPVHDLVVHPRERELVAGTHGRSVWILDALPIQELADPEARQAAVTVFPVADVEYERGWRYSRDSWFYRSEEDPEITIPVWTKEGGAATFEVLDTDGRVLRRLERHVLPGVDAFTWDLLLDEELALAAEAERLAAAAGDDGDAKKRRKKKAEETPREPELHARAKTPWAEAVRLGWPVYVTPGDYELRVATAAGSATADFTVTPPRERDPRTPPEPKIRGEEDDDRSRP